MKLEIGSLIVVKRAKRLLRDITPAPWSRGEEHESMCSIDPIHAAIKKHGMLAGNKHWEADVEFITHAPALMADMIICIELLRKRLGDE